MYINAHEGDIVFEDQVDGLQIKGVRFYTMNDGRRAIEQLGQLVLDEGFGSLSYDDEQMDIFDLNKSLG